MDLGDTPDPPAYNSAGYVDDAIAAAKARYDHADAPYDPEALALIRAAETMRERLYVSYPAELRSVLADAEAEDHDRENTRARGYAMGVRVAAGLLGMPEGVDPETRRRDNPDPMPVFTLLAKDQLAPAAIGAYHELCLELGITDQARQVYAAYQEIRAWQERHSDRVKLPDHEHVPIND